MTEVPANDQEPRVASVAGLREKLAIDPGAVRAVGWSFAYFFSVLCSYYIIRPLRDEMGVTVGVDGLERLFFIVFGVMLAAVPLFGWLVSTFPKKHVAPVVYLFFIANLVVFWLVLSTWKSSTLVASMFFVWVSVFNLFVVSLFWIVMADLWSTADAKRYYGMIAAGGSAGAFCGPLITQSIVHKLGPANLLLVSALFLGVAVGCVFALRRELGHAHQADHDKPAGDGILAGAERVFKSPYLFQIAMWILVANLISTFFYFEQARIIGAALPERADRVQLFARMDLTVSVLTILAQVFVTAAVMRALPVGWCVAALPVSAALGLLALAVAPSLWVIVGVIVVERAIGFAISNPAARVLYTVVEPEDKYKAQNFIDTVVFRGGDAASGWLFNSVAKAAGLATPAVAMLTVPFALLWVWLSLRLGNAQEEQAATQHMAKAKGQA